jgi:hypothetical protein
MKLAILGIVAFASIALAAGVAGAKRASGVTEFYDAGATPAANEMRAHLAHAYEGGSADKATGGLGLLGGYEAGSAWDAGAR